MDEAAAASTPTILPGVLPETWPVQADLLQWCQQMTPATATLLVIGGSIYLLFGFTLYRWLVVVNAFIVGAHVGSVVGASSEAALVGGLVGGVLAAAIAWPLMKYAVALMGGVFGIVAGASLWRSFGLEGQFTWAGASVGLVLFGLLSFIVFRTSVMLYTSLQGAVMLIFGVLGLAYKYPQVAQSVTENMTLKPFLLPLLIFVPSVLGVLYQQTRGPEGDAKKK